MRDESVPRPSMPAAGLTVVAMLAFAANSLLCRLALRDAHIDAASFGAVRVVAGALMLAVVLQLVRVRARARALAVGRASPGPQTTPAGADGRDPAASSAGSPMPGAPEPSPHAGLFALTARGAAAAPHAAARDAMAGTRTPSAGGDAPAARSRAAQDGDVRNAAASGGLADGGGRVTPGRLGEAGDWWAAWMLFAYVGCFSFAYLRLPAGTGALILFAAVQLTMFGTGLARGERFAPAGWAGLALAATGLLYLLLPGASTPALAPALLMAGAGAAWGVYSLRGRGVPDPLAATTANFVRAAPLTILLALLYAWQADLASPFPASASASPAAHNGLQADARGITFAIISGALTSGLGYVIWYAALRRLTALQAASVQLSVPVLAALGGVLLLGEALTPRLLLAALAILGGIAVVLTRRATPG